MAAHRTPSEALQPPRWKPTTASTKTASRIQHRPESVREFHTLQYPYTNRPAHTTQWDSPKNSPEAPVRMSGGKMSMHRASSTTTAKTSGANKRESKSAKGATSNVEREDAVAPSTCALLPRREIEGCAAISFRRLHAQQKGAGVLRNDNRLCWGCVMKSRGD